MKLRGLVLNKKEERLNNKLAENMLKREDMSVENEELLNKTKQDLSEEEQIELEKLVDEYEAKVSALEEEKEKLEEEIEAVKKEKEELEDKEPDTRSKDNTKKQNKTIGGENRMKVNKFETRGQMVERLNVREVNDFYRELVDVVKSKRSLTGGDLTIPGQVVDVIQTQVRQYSNFYDEVQVEKLGGDATAFVDGKLPEAVWTDACAGLTEMDIEFLSVKLEQHKVGGYVPICNAYLEDSLVNLANHVETRIAKAIAKAIDKAILVGTGTSNSQPLGVVEFLKTELERNVESDGNVLDIVQNIGLIGADEEDVDEVIAVMNRQTYYKYFVSRLFTLTDDGRVVAQSDSKRVLPDGTRVVLNQFTPADTVILGDFKRYILGERQGIKLESSSHVQFIQDNTVYKGTARYDGKPTSKEHFLVIKITQPLGG